MRQQSVGFPARYHPTLLAKVTPVLLLSVVGVGSVLALIVLVLEVLRCGAHTWREHLGACRHLGHLVEHDGMAIPFSG